MLSERHVSVGIGSHYAPSMGTERGVRRGSVGNAERDGGVGSVGDERRDVKLCAWRGYLYQWVVR